MSYSITDFLGLGNVSCAFIEQNYFGEESYHVVKKRENQPSEVPRTAGKKTNIQIILQCENFLAPQHLTQNQTKTFLTSQQLKKTKNCLYLQKKM